MLPLKATPLDSFRINTNYIYNLKLNIFYWTNLKPEKLNEKLNITPTQLKQCKSISYNLKSVISVKLTP